MFSKYYVAECRNCNKEIMRQDGELEERPYCSVCEDNITREKHMLACKILKAMHKQSGA